MQATNYSDLFGVSNPKFRKCRSRVIGISLKGKLQIDRKPASLADA